MSGVIRLQVLSIRNNGTEKELFNDWIHFSLVIWFQARFTFKAFYTSPKKNYKKQSHRNQDAWTCALLDTKSLERGAASINKPDQLQSGTLTVSVFCQSYDLNSATQHHPAQNDPWTESGIINLVKLVQSKLIGGGWSQFVIHAEMFTEAYKMESIYTILGVNIKKTSHYGTQVSVK